MKAGISFFSVVVLAMFVGISSTYRSPPATAPSELSDSGTGEAAGGMVPNEGKQAAASISQESQERLSGDFGPGHPGLAPELKKGETTPNKQITFGSANSFIKPSHQKDGELGAITRSWSAKRIAETENFLRTTLGLNDTQMAQYNDEMAKFRDQLSSAMNSREDHPDGSGDDSIRLEPYTQETLRRISSDKQIAIRQMLGPDGYRQYQAFQRRQSEEFLNSLPLKEQAKLRRRLADQGS